MPRALIQCLFLVVWLVQLDADVYRDRPRIKTNDGHLILQPAADKNIYLQTNGPKSTVFVGGVNVLKINITDTGSEQSQPSFDDISNYLNGPRGILERLSRLETHRPRNTVNMTLWRKVNQLRARVSTLEIRIQNMLKDQCDSHPCLHGGTCLNLANGYHCLCPNNWEGENCDVDVNECRNFQGTDLGCQNGAHCKNTPGSYECECNTGWYGIHCTKRRKDCSGGDFEMCGHGTCVPTSNGEGIKCICDQGWTTNGTGEACLTDVNECESTQGPRCSVNPRVECINLPGTFRCGQCPPGYEGDGYICSDIDECTSTTTPNGGCSTSPFVTCHNTVGSRICGPCPTGYQGDGVTCTLRSSCSINRGGCHPSAQCVDNAALGGQMAQCICPQGMEGDGIGLHGCYVSTSNFTRGCDSNPCGIHGQCHPLRSGYTCICYRGYGGPYCEAAHDYCSSNPCLNGGSCRNDESSPRKFRCECTARYTGDLCHMPASTCGGYLRAEEGSIVYPMSNKTYENNVRCAWVINTDSNKVINVTFSKFNLEPGNHETVNEDCKFDFLQIHDGFSSSSQIIGRFCGNQFPKGGNIISSHNNLYFWFRSDSTVVSDGFALHWTSIDPICGGEIDATVSGHISSPGSPGKYPPNRDCYWHLTTTFGKRIQLHFYSLDIQSHSNCSFDYVAIFDGGLKTDSLIGQYCNSSIPAPVTSSGSEMLVHFHSDEFSTGYGFQATFAPADGVPGCGGLFTTDKGEISSPSYDGRYLSGITCEYQIRTNPETKIRINFKSFNLEHSRRCSYDYLKVYDGPNENAPLVGKFCGSTSYPKSYTSTTNQLLLIFRSDLSVSFGGFRITYETVCQQVIEGDSGFIKSPGYPISYPSNIMCEYLLGTTPGKVIQLTFQDFDIEDNNYANCAYDNVEIRDGMDVNATLFGKYCGGSERYPPPLTSTHNYMYVRFSSDLSLSGSGFYANFTTLDVECGGIFREANGTINHYYSNNQHCVWMIIAPEGMIIKLTWNRFSLEKFDSCAGEYVELSEIDENNEIISLGKFCGRNLPPAITTTTNRLQISFQSDESIRLEGFSLSYEFLDERSQCGGNYTKTHGTLYSPGWPKRYSANRDCKWYITAPPGRRIALNISQFDIEQPIAHKCTYGDFLEIRNGASERSPLIGTYCGRLSTRIISMSNALYLYFHSDSYLSGNGFKIDWDSAVFGCGGVLTGIAGSIMSPNYPNNYHENAECFYKIVANLGSKIRIHFVELDIERTRKCRNDFVEIFDGRDENGASLGRFCELNRQMRAIESTTNYMYIKFRSDYSIEGKGFLMEYNTTCQNNLTGLHGIIESPGFPGSFPANLNCLWTITVPKGNRINITFTDFDISFARYTHSFRSSSIGRNIVNIVRPCYSNYLQMKETSDLNFGEKKCGHSLPDRYTSTSNSLQIKLVTDSVIFRSGSGFRLEWTRYGCGGYIRKSFGTIHVDSSMTSRGELECEWLIEGQQGRRITVNIQNLYMEDSKNCTKDGIEFYNGQNSNTPLLTKICHRNSDSLFPSVVSGTNIILIRFVKQSSLKDVQFEANFDSYQSGCGGRLNTLSGVIHSANYPKNYDNNVDCKWYIEVPGNHRIELNFTEFDLFSVQNSDCDDYVTIYDDEILLSSNYTKRICPNTPIVPFISKKNVLVLQFISNSYGTAKGFKANFTVICGATITAHYDGIIANDKWHTTHIIDNCTWTILAPSQEQKISLTITYISIPKDTNILTNRKCPSSFLRVLDGDDADAPLVDEYCGRKVPPMIVSRGSALTLVFGAYNGTAQGQFSVHYSPIMSACGGVLTSEEGSIASPNYPQSYPINSSCEWILSTSPGNKVYITFEQFDIKWTENCNEDYLEVRENDAAGTLLGVYCGADIPTNTSSASKLYIKFQSNNENGGKGFVIHYGFLHGNEIYGLEKGELASPLYPHYYEGAGEFYWRIAAERQTISIIVTTAEIPTNGPICTNSLTFYDGDDEQAPILETLCGILKMEKEIKTTTNIVFIKFKLDESNSGSMFYIRWATSDTSLELTDLVLKPNCGFNETKLLTPGQKVTIRSPGYPHEYKENLNCEWVFKAPPGRHVNLHFQTFKLEETETCFADSVSVFSSTTPTVWNPIKERFCLSSDTKEDFNSSNFMKITFQTDSSLNREGFEAQVSSVCGGFINELSGTVEPRYEDLNIMRPFQKCDWTIKVRPGRQIKLNFEHFNITNRENDCTTYVVLRNGDSVEAPMLGNGKYCGRDYENRDDIETSSNAVFITYNADHFMNMRTFTNFRLRYEEKGVECGGKFALDDYNKWKVLSSPNYPNVPTPYSQCIWVFKGPPGEILRIDFIERFDLEQHDDCSVEFVEIRDGSTDIAPVLGRYCGQAPSTVKTQSNNVYITYYTQLAEPRNGFKANVSIDVCGGTIIASEGEITSPGYPRLPPLPPYTICEWRIIGPKRFNLIIKPQDIQLPISTHNHLCETKVQIEELEGSNNTILKTFCASIGDRFDNDMSSIETASNEVVIKLEIGDYDMIYRPTVTNRGFRFTFDSSRPVCGGKITTPEGFLTTIGYPQETTIRYCQWQITVPDITRRVRLEILDSNSEKHRIGIYNDLHFQTSIKILPSTEGSETRNVYESTGHTMAVYLWLDSVSLRHRFKARFSSDEASLCGGELRGERGELTSPDLDRAYTCEWTYKPNLPMDSANSTTFSTLYVTAKVNTSKSVTRQHCTYSDPKLTIKTINYHYLNVRICGNTEKSIRLPASETTLTATKDKASSMYFHVEWKLNPCGGVIEISENPINILDVPNGYNETLDCAWLLTIPLDSRVEFKLEGSFQLDCDKEIVYIGQENGYSDGPNIAEYCKGKMQDSPLQLSFTTISVQYHSDIKDKTNVRLMVKTITDHCGGTLTRYQRLFESPNFPKSYSPNLECSWEILSDLGNRVALHFIDSFRIEERSNCSKDAVIIYDWRDDSWVQMARLCGRLLPPNYNSTNNRMKVVLRTDADTQMDGFRATWEPICGGKYNATEKVQYLYSPSDILGSIYEPNMNCKYTISGASGNKKVVVKFLEFELEGTYPSCDYDNLTVLDYVDDYFSEYTYCGSEKPISLVSRKIGLIFRTDAYVQRKGFKLMYYTYSCGGQIEEPTVIHSNPHTKQYGENENCTWVIVAPKDKIVVIKFQYIYLEITPDCKDDHVSVFNSKTTEEDKRIALMCGNINKTTVLRSTGNAMVVQFESDAYGSSKGFKANVYFVYSPSVGCGGEIDLTTLPPGTNKPLNSPLINGNSVYENFLDCQWNIIAPIDFDIKIKFTQFHIAPCDGVNQTAIGFSKCECDYVEIIDGVNPHDLLIGTYCGHNIPGGQGFISSKNLMSIRLYTDGEIASAGFKAELSLQRQVCGQTEYTVGYNAKTITSPGYSTGSIAGGVHCVYYLDASTEMYETIHIKIKNLDLRAGDPEPSQCNKDKLVIVGAPQKINTTLGKDYIIRNTGFLSDMYIDEIINPEQFEYCGMKTNVDIYLQGSLSVHLQTSPDSDVVTHKGLEMEFSFIRFCGSNYTELYGWLKTPYNSDENAEVTHDCSTLITVPENYTISLYFINVFLPYNLEEGRLDIMDGSKRLHRFTNSFSFYNIKAFFSTGRTILLNNHVDNGKYINYELVYMATDKGRGCGGKIHNLIGIVTSPMYPERYQKLGSCEWELETPSHTHLQLQFTVFDFGNACDTNYLQLVDRSGNTFATYCEQSPAIYTSTDNYVKIVYTTDSHNAGTGWAASFKAVR